MGRPSDDRNSFIVVFQKFLDKIITSDHLIIIDPYIFPNKHDPDYAVFFVDILRKYFDQIKRISFVTNESYNSAIKTTVFDLIKSIKPELDLEIKAYEFFHDRFWLCNNKGLFVGTSLNGVGKKYTLIDYIKKKDVSLLFNEIQDKGIITL